MTLGESGLEAFPGGAVGLERLRSWRGELLDTFAANAWEELAAARMLSRAELLGALPLLLDVLAQALGDVSPSCAQEVDALGREHGRARAGSASYSLTDLLTEFRILRSAVLAVLRNDGEGPPALEDVVRDRLDRAMGAAADEFGRARFESDLAATARAEERHRLEAIFDASPAAMALWRGPDMVFDMVNPAYQGIFPGRPLLGRPFLEAIPEFRDQPFFTFFSRVLETGEPFIGREVLARHRTTADGPVEDHYYDFTYVRIDDRDGRPYGVYDHAVDVTERVLATRSAELRRLQLQQSVRDLEQERELRERFVASVSHDLRTPLSAARMSAQLLSRRVGDPDAVRRGADRITDNLDRVNRMIRDLLDVSRINAGQSLALALSPCDLRQIAAETLQELSTIHGDRFVLECAEPVEGVWNPEALRRILENLCSNAVKYGAAHLPIEVSIVRGQHEVRLRVHNQGPPIPSASLAHLFEPFLRTRSAQRTGQVGWGLGLTLVKALAEAQGGRIEVRSNTNEGTTFEVTLPASRL